MSIAFEICVEDIGNVLYKHKTKLTEEKIKDIFENNINAEAVEKAALSETEFDLQILAAYSEIGDQLKKLGIL